MKPKNPAAFARPASVCEATGRLEWAAAQAGMGLRDYMAAQALVALLLRECYPSPEETARAAYRVADAMIEARDGATP